MDAHHAGAFRVKGAMLHTFFPFSFLSELILDAHVLCLLPGKLCRAVCHGEGFDHFLQVSV